MVWTIWIFLGSLCGGLGVGLGAFGAHYLKKILTVEALTVFETGVRYQMYHSLALLTLGIIAIRIESYWIKAAGLCFFTGILVFSGSIYALAILDIKKLGAMTPVGGVLFLFGWISLAVSVLRA